ncbi:hypothetical protein BDR04DRAFT_690216 [Suillus decipiens]|nr:hypothetical protein BDR04DRAFT_690216 [Suillus decipiens]
MRQRTRNAWRRPVQPFLICVQPLVSLQGGFDPQPYCQVVSTCKHFAVITSQNTTCPHSRVVIEMLKLVLPCLRTMLSMALLLVQIRTCFKISSAVSTVSHETYGSPVIVANAVRDVYSPHVTATAELQIALGNLARADTNSNFWLYPCTRPRH